MTQYHKHAEQEKLGTYGAVAAGNGFRDHAQSSIFAERITSSGHMQMATGERAPAESKAAESRRCPAAASTRVRVSAEITRGD